MISRRGCRRALPTVLLLFCFAVHVYPQTPAEPLAEAPSASPEAAPAPIESAAAAAPGPAEKDPSGIFTSGRGDEIRICRSEEDDAWVMSMKDLSGRAATYVLKGDAGSLSPVGMESAVPFGAASADIVVDGGKMYGKAERDGKVVEFFSAGDGAPIQTAVNGVSSGAMPGSAEESELRLVARDFAEKWAMTKRMTFSVSADRFTARAPSAGAATAAPGRAEGTVRANEFARSGDLSEDDAKTLVETGRGGRERMAATKTFAK